MQRERFAILDHGCKVNRYDGERVRSELRRLGLVETDVEGPAPADLLVLNACAVTDRAVRKGRQALRRMRRVNPGARLLVTGCMTDADRAGYQRVAPEVLTLPSHARDQVRDRLVEVLGHAATAAATTHAPLPPLDGDAFADRTRAFLKVQDGCDARCAFCVIPQVRGGARSRPRAEILDEARRLIERGFKELVVCGIHLGHYGRDTGDDVVALTEALDALPGTFRIRLSSLEVGEADERLARTIAACRRAVPHLHLPLQSGDDDVLRRMRRPYTSRGFLARLARLRAANPSLAVTTDVIAGFPGESAAAFAATLGVLRAACFSKVHVFPFSPRAGTEAATLPGQVQPREIRARVAALLRVERRLRAEFDRALLGAEVEVLVESCEPMLSVGLSEHYRRVRLPGGIAAGTLVRCSITGSVGDLLLGAPLP